MNIVKRALSRNMTKRVPKRRNPSRRRLTKTEVYISLIAATSFVARGTGFAPIKAMIEQQLKLTPTRDLRLFWGVTDTTDFYELDLLSGWAKSDPNFRCVLTARTVSADFMVPEGLEFRNGTCYDALAASRFEISKRDVYVAGPRKTVEATLRVLRAKGVPREQILIDSYGN